MSEIHFEAPTADSTKIILGWVPRQKAWINFSSDYVARYWSDVFTAWMEMPPAPVKPKRFVVEKHCGDGVGGALRGEGHTILQHDRRICHPHPRSRTTHCRHLRGDDTMKTSTVNGVTYDNGGAKWKGGV